ncbi:MAG TPA: GTPase ObgE, partial [Verrucomicrobiales bacterium]|nr:GTPase ObgE [Verrucomicrobiales bacterium]
MFIDQVKVYARAGHGGRGCVSFRREAFVPKGGPDGGDGGRGGSVILEASHDLNNLIAQFYVPRLIAKNGNHGEGQKKSGRGGKDLIVKVPCGTVVWKLPTPAEELPEPDPELVQNSEGEQAMVIDFDAAAEEEEA